MPECHDCPKNGKGSPDCLKCKGPGETNNHGQRMAHFQHAADIELVAHGPAGTPDFGLPACCTDALRRLLAEFRGLNVEQLALVCSALNGQSLSAFARSRGVSRQSVFLMRNRLAEKSPVFDVVFERFEKKARK